MNAKVLSIAGILLALGGLMFVFPVSFAKADIEGVACPGPMCVCSYGNQLQGGGPAGWGAPSICNVGTYGCTGDNGCCSKCENWGFDYDHIVGICKNACNLISESWCKSCPV